MQDDFYDSTTDGKDHIRISVDGKTKLGRYLALSAVTTFDVAGYGTFKSLDAFRVYIAQGCTNEFTRAQFGSTIERQVRNLRNIDDARFHDPCVGALVAKIEQTPGLIDLVRNNSLPYASYEMMDGIPVEVPLPKWFLPILKAVFQRNYLTKRLQSTPKARPAVGGAVREAARVPRL